MLFLVLLQCLVKNMKNRMKNVQSENNRAPKATTKVISNEATVKRFVEILQETKIEEEKSSCLEETETQQISNKTIEFTREMDDFFLNANNASTFSSIPISYDQEDTENVSTVDRGASKSETSIAYWKEDRRKDGKGKDRSIKGTNVAENESLHPSWAAKRKQQDILKQGFQGKKIKFEEE
ncbi:hypothetical protein ANTPLA_LOCUS4006 [Anthophora plagiata]